MTQIFLLLWLAQKWSNADWCKNDSAKIAINK